MEIVIPTDTSIIFNGTILSGCETFISAYRLPETAFEQIMTLVNERMKGALKHNKVSITITETPTGKLVSIIEDNQMIEWYRIITVPLL